MKNKKVLITGGIGFIGTSLALKLIKLNYKIILFDIRDSNKGSKIYVNNDKIEFIKGDTNDTELLKSIFEKYTISGVIHFAAVSRVEVAQNNQEECVRTNINGTKSLLRAIETTENKPWLIFGSSREVYGEPKTLPVKENFEKKYVNIYGDSKIQGERLFIEFSKKHNNSCIILRFSNVYGNQYDLFERVIPRFIKSIVNNKTLTIEGGEQLIDFTHVNDTVKGIIKSIEYIDTENQVIDDFHILPGIGWTLYQLVEYIEGIIKKKAIMSVNEKRNYDVEKFIGDNSKVRNKLNITNFISLKEGLEISIPIYLKNIE